MGVLRANPGSDLAFVSGELDTPALKAMLGFFGGGSGSGLGR